MLCSPSKQTKAVLLPLESNSKSCNVYLSKPKAKLEQTGSLIEIIGKSTYKYRMFPKAKGTKGTLLEPKMVKTNGTFGDVNEISLVYVLAVQTFKL